MHIQEMSSFSCTITIATALFALEYKTQGPRVKIDFYTGKKQLLLSLAIRDLESKIGKTFLSQEESLLGLLEIIEKPYI